MTSRSTKVNLASLRKLGKDDLKTRLTVAKLLVTSPGALLEHHLESFNYMINQLFPELLNDPMRPTTFMRQIHSITALDSFIDDSGKRISQSVPINPEEDNISFEIKYKEITFDHPVRPTKAGSYELVEEMIPLQASATGDTYAAQLYVRIQFLVFLNKKDTTYKLADTEFTVPMCLMPAMVGSQACTLYNKSPSELYMLGEDTKHGGAYFIIDGKPRIIVMVERVEENRPHITVERKSKAKSKKKGKNEHDENQRISYRCTIHARHEGDFNTIFQTAIIYDGIEEDFYIQIFPFTANHKIPLVVALKMLGMTSDNDIISSVIGKDASSDELNAQDLKFINEYIVPSLKKSVMSDGRKIKTTEDAMRYFLARQNQRIVPEEEIDLNDKQRKNKLKDFFQRFIPNVDSLDEKATHVTYILWRKFLRTITMGDPTMFMDRDSFAYKRLDTAGVLTAQLLKLVLDRATTTIRGHYRTQQVDNINELVQTVMQSSKNKFISAFKKIGIIKAFRNGKWQLSSSGNSNMTVKQDVTSQLSNESFIDDLSNKRRMTVQQEASVRLTTARNLHATHFGFICPLETPEGKKIGLLKNLAMGAKLTTGISSADVTKFVLAFPRVKSATSGEVPITEFSKYVEIIIDHKLVALVLPDNAGDLYTYLIQGRRHGDLHMYTGIILDDIEGQFRLNTDTGRGIYPLFIVENGDVLYNAATYKAIVSGKIGINELLFSNKYRCIEYIDLEEAMYNVYCALSLDDLREADPKVNPYTHAIIDANLMLGVVASIPAFFTSNPTIRSNFATAHTKHAPSPLASNFPNKFSPERKILTVPERQLASTVASKEFLELDNYSSGQNIMMLYDGNDGYNQEDSIEINRAAIERGMFHINMYVDHNRDIALSERIERPTSGDVGQMRETSKYDHLDKNGIVRIGAVVKKGDVILGIVNYISGKLSDEKIANDASLIYRRNYPGTIVSVQSFVSASKGFLTYRITTKESRPPVAGDKFSAQHGQKATISIIHDEVDMPFTEEGLRPDAIINGHAFPKRMTMGMPIECAAAYICTKMGIRMDATPFSGIMGDDIYDYMRKIGDTGYVTMYDGATGRKKDQKLNLVPSFYMRQRHMAGDKIHARAAGKMMNLTRQPPAGKRQNGGPKFGYMETDALKGHGTFKLLSHLMTDHSDGMEMYICGKCGTPATYSPSDNDYYCNTCNASPIHKVYIPYTTILLQRYLMSVGISMRLQIKNKKLNGFIVDEAPTKYMKRIEM